MSKHKLLMLSFKRFFLQDIWRPLRENKRKLFCCAVIVALALTYFRRFIFEPGLPTGDDSIGVPMFLGVKYLNNDWFSAWWPYHSLGHPYFSASWLNLVYIPLMWTIKDPAIVTKVIVFSYFLLGAFSALLLSLHFTKNDYASLLAALFYAFNPWILAEYIRGHYGICFGYSLFPLLFLVYDRAILKRRFGSIVAAALVTSFFITSAYEHFILFFAVVIPLFILMHLITQWSNIRLLLKSAISVVAVIALALLLSANYVVPYLFARESVPLLSFSWSIEQVYAFSSKSILESVTLQYDNNIYDIWLYPTLPLLMKYLFLGLFPILAFAAVFLRRNRYTVFFTLLAITSVFLAKGLYPPYGEVYFFIYNNIPGFNTLRVAYRFIALAALSYSVLIGISVTAIRDKLHVVKLPSTTLRGFSKIFNQSRLRKIAKKNSKKLVDIAVPSSILALILLYSWQGAFVTLDKSFVLPEEVTAPYKWISLQSGDFRVATLPFDVPDIFNDWVIRTRDFGYYSPAVTGKDAVYYFKEDMGAFPPALDFLGFTNRLVVDNKTDDVLKILGPAASVRYVVSQQYASVPQRNSIFRQDGAQTVYVYPSESNDSEARILENVYWEPRLYATSSYAIVVGGREALTSLSDIEGFRLGAFPILFNEMIQSDTSYFSLLNSSNFIVFSDADFLDFAMQSIPSENASIIKAAEFGSSYSDPSNYWIKSYELARYGGKLVINQLTLSTSKIRSEIDIPFNVKSDGPYELWIRLANRGNLSLGIDNQMKLIDTQPSTNPYSFLWLNVTIPFMQNGAHAVNLVNIDGSLDVDVIIIAPPRVIEESLNKAERLLQDLPSRFMCIMEAENFVKNETKSDPSPLHIWNASNGYVLYFPNASKIEKSIFVPKAGKYALMVKSMDGPGYGNITIGIDDSGYYSIKSDSFGTQFSQRQVGPYSLEAGYHKISVLASKAYLDKLVVFSLYSGESDLSLSDVFSVKNTPHLSYMKIGLNNFLLQVKSEAPVFIVFTEAYNPLWKVHFENQDVRSTITNSFSNGFYITKVGEYNVTIEFEGQQISDFSWAVSISTLMSLAICLPIWHRRNSLKKTKSWLEKK